MPTAVKFFWQGLQARHYRVSDHAIGIRLSRRLSSAHSRDRAHRSILAGVRLGENEQVEPWASIVIAANGDVSTFSPEFMEASAPLYNDFVFETSRGRSFPTLSGLLPLSAVLERSLWVFPPVNPHVAILASAAAAHRSKTFAKKAACKHGNRVSSAHHTNMCRCVALVYLPDVIRRNRH